MKKFLLLSLAALAVVGVVTLSKPADAGPVYLATVASTDGGPYTQEFDLRKYPKNRICLAPADTRTCFKLGMRDGGNPSILPDCTKDPFIPAGQSGQAAATAELYCFDVAARSALVLRNLDAGAASTNVYLDEQNPPRY